LYESAPKEAFRLKLSDTSLVKQCLKGDNAGFDLIVKRYQRLVYAFCYRMLGEREDAEEAAQESFVKAYYALDKFRQDASFLTWIIKIASNTCIDISRARVKRSAVSIDEIEGGNGSLPSGQLSPEEQAVENEESRLVRKAVLHLPERQRAAMVMFHFEEMSIREISQSLGMPEGTVKSDLHIAREILRGRLEGVVTV
jgi:RNA polymerase sigma-70 factor (ECF subfamily)